MAPAHHVLMLDCETTGLDPEVHAPWEYAWRAFLVDGHAMVPVSHGTGFLQLTPQQRATAEHVALEVGRFAERYTERLAHPRAAMVERLTRLVPKGARLCGSNPAFDAAMLGPAFDEAGVERPWHYHLVDVPTLAAGYLAGQGGIGYWLPASDGSGVPVADRLRASALKSDELSFLLGIDPSDYDRHTAMGDVDWTVAMYARVHNLRVVQP